MQVKRNKLIEEEYTLVRHKSGLDIYLFPKKHTSAYAVIGTKFGSMDNVFRAEGDEEDTVLPDGVAHFLEHKLFEDESGVDAFERFAQFGGNANAYTSFSKTVFLFSCTECFKENLTVLLDTVTHPHFTKENVQKEIGIIGEEIRMYDDNPGWQVYFNMLRGMYVTHPIRSDIAGTEESISKITPELLYKAYECFYSPAGMALVVCGDVELQTVIDVADAVLPDRPPRRVTLRPTSEPDGIAAARINRCMEVGQPLFAIGIKEKPASDGREAMLREAAHEILQQLLFGSSGDFYTRCYESGLIGSRFSFNYSYSRSFAFVEISGAAGDPQALFDEICREISYRKQNFFEKEDFERIRRAVYADNLFDFESTDSIANSFLTYIFEGGDMLDYAGLLADIDYDTVKDIFMQSYDTNKAVLSTVIPEKEHTQ